MNSGKAIRLNRILAPDGRTVIAALDHGIAGVTPLAALEHPAQIVTQVIAGGADAILTTPGIVRECARAFGKIGLIVRADSGATALTGRWSEMGVMLPVEDALALGADGIAAMGIVGTDGEGQSLRGLGRLAAECERYGLVLLAEMLPGGFDAVQVSVDQIAAAARVGADLGADLIKIRYGGSPEAFRAVTTGCYRPVVILGGSKQSPSQLLDQVRGALAAGAIGVAVGRNIWQSPDPAGITRELVQAVHG
jgi:DhnA family fructose-bisphosphate aldolase class Ia